MTRVLLLLAALAAFAYGAASQDGARAQSSPTGVVRYTALGDSVTWQNHYVAAYSAYLAADLGTEVSVANFGTPSWLSASLLFALREDQAMRASVAEADVITIFIGLNDFQWMRGQYLDADSAFCPPPKDGCMPAVVDWFTANWTAIIQEIRSLNNSTGTAVRALTIYNPYVAEDSAQGNFAYFDSYLQQMNAVIDSSGARGVRVADVHDAFNGPGGDQDATAMGFFTAPDVLHPNVDGHERIAHELRAQGYLELDGDGDGMLDAEMDTDGDGCADVEEVGPNPLLGGGRDPTNRWDFYDVNGTRTINAADFGLVRANFKPFGPVPPEDVVYDRSGGGATWAPGPPDNRINAVDIALVRASYNAKCDAPS
jgi:lysophospholipase L1-like esterase